VTLTFSVLEVKKFKARRYKPHGYSSRRHYCLAMAFTMQDYKVRIELRTNMLWRATKIRDDQANTHIHIMCYIPLENRYLNKYLIYISTEVISSAFYYTHPQKFYSHPCALYSRAFVIFFTLNVNVSKLK